MRAGSHLGGLENGREFVQNAGLFARLDLYSYGLHNAHIAGKSLWTVWTAPSQPGAESTEIYASLLSSEDAERAKACAASAPKIVAGNPFELGQRIAQRFAQEPSGHVVVDVRSADGLRDDFVDHTEL